MKERPILFSAPMVRALLAGMKTQTRRMIKPQPPDDRRFKPVLATDDEGIELYCGWAGMIPIRSPYGKVGDQLWVREAWRIGAWDEDDGSVAIDYMASAPTRTSYITIPESADPNGEMFERYWMQSSDDAEHAGLRTDEDGKYQWQPGESPCRIRPSIFMPRWASRIQLEITGVRIERLQNISERDSMDEGITGEELFRAQGYAPLAYQRLWESINGVVSWEANPWVWAIEFKVIGRVK